MKNKFKLLIIGLITFIVSISNVNALTINIKDNKSIDMSVDVSSSDYISDIKGEISDDLSIPMQNIQLTFGDQILLDDRSISSYNIDDNSTLYMDIIKTLTRIDFIEPIIGNINVGSSESINVKIKLVESVSELALGAKKVKLYAVKESGGNSLINGKEYIEGTVSDEGFMTFTVNNTYDYDVSLNFIAKFDGDEFYEYTYSVLYSSTNFIGNKYLVTLDFNDYGGTGAEIKVTKGSKIDIDLLPEMIEDGYTFVGWYTDTDLNNAFNFNTIIDSNITLYAKWIKDYQYEFISGGDQTFRKGSISEYTFRIDGDYNLFKDIELGDLELKKDIDYNVTEGSTIITFTSTGLAKLNNLSAGTYNINVNYTNNRVAIGRLTITNDIINNPNTKDELIVNIIISIISFVGLVSSAFYYKKTI